MAIATLHHDAPAAASARWRPDPDLVDHFGHRARQLTDDELQTEIARIDHIFWMAAEAGIAHSTAYLVELASERAACVDTLNTRAQHGYEFREPAPGKFSRATLDAIKERAVLEEEIGRSLELARRGRTYVARCPFHHPDRTPSFTVFPHTQSYYCFGCHAHGDIFTWLMDSRKLSFPAAVRELAARYGMRVEAGPDGMAKNRSSGSGATTTTPPFQGRIDGLAEPELTNLVSRLLQH